jgi:hypothetical protein
MDWFKDNNKIILFIFCMLSLLGAYMGYYDALNDEYVGIDAELIFDSWFPMSAPMFIFLIAKAIWKF